MYTYVVVPTCWMSAGGALQGASGRLQRGIAHVRCRRLLHQRLRSLRLPSLPVGQESDYRRSVPFPSLFIVLSSFLV